MGRKKVRVPFRAELMGQKRVCAHRRAPDGSAFKTCENCGTSVAVAIADMHVYVCEGIKEQERSKEAFIKKGIKSYDLKIQPRSAFHFFKESFVQSNEVINELDADRKVFETWKNMSKQERLPYYLQADKVNCEYDRVLLQEVEDMLWKREVDEEADSAEVGKFDKKYDNSSYSHECDRMHSFLPGTSESYYFYSDN